MRNIFLLALVNCWAPASLPAQCPVVDFEFSPTACRNENIRLSNLSDAGVYHWDFCTGELNNIPSASETAVLPGVNGRPGIEMVRDGEDWVGFVTGTFTNSLHRLEFANGIDEAPTGIENLGDFGGVLNNPGQIRILQENGAWHGILHNAGAGELFRLNFTGGLRGAISLSLLASQVGGINSGMAMGRDPVHGWVCVMSNTDNGFTLLRLGNDLDVPASVDIIHTPAVPNPNNLGDVDLISHCGSWYGASANFGGGNVYIMKFGADLFSVPEVSQVASLAVSNNGRLRFVRDGEEYFLFVTALDGVLNKLAFGADPGAAPSVIGEGDIQGVLQPNIYAFGTAKQDSRWILYAVSQSDGKLFRIDYAQECPAIPEVSNEASPVVTYGAEGAYNISLTGVAASSGDVKTRTITVSALSSPDIAFSSENMCVDNDINFDSRNASGDIQTYDWDFGDGTAHSDGAVAVHQYTSPGEFTALLEVTATNRCRNTASGTVAVYPQPSVDFTLPDGLLCTNSERVFENLTPDVFAGHLAYQWYDGASLVSNERDLVYAFEETGTHTIRLVGAIPGCSGVIEKTSGPFQAGPSIDFFSEGKCESDDVQFTAVAGEPVADVTWDFDDGTTAHEEHPVHIFEQAGHYLVSLSATSANGCTSTIDRLVQIFSKPEVDFTVAAPPQACSGTPTPFYSLTPDPDDSNLASWLWSFNDGAVSASSDEPDPVYTFSADGAHSVSLTVRTDEGCEALIEKEVSILAPPSAVITSSPACLGQGVDFQAAGGGIESYYWEIGTSYYLTPELTHTFQTTGDHRVRVTLVGDNHCMTVYENTVGVPVPLVPDFSVSRHCVGVAAELTDVTAGADPVVHRLWDFNGEDTRTGASVSFIFDSAGEEDIMLAVTAASGCRYETVRTITVNPPPEALFTVSPAGGAAPLKAQFDNRSPANTRQSWDFGDGKSTSAERSPLFVFQDTGAYTVQLTVIDEAGCQSLAAMTIQVVAPLPDVRVNLISTAPNPDGSQKVIVTLENAGNTVIENLPVEIDVGGNTSIVTFVDGPVSPGNQFNMISGYSIGRTDNLNFLCAEARLEGDVFSADNRFCIDLKNAVFVFHSYPNPVTNELRIEWISPDEREVDVTLADSFGRKINGTRIASAIGLNRVIFDVAGEKTGIYFLTVKGDALFETRRVLIAREN